MERKTRVVKVADLKIGGDNPIIIQSMTNTNSADVEATVKQINELEKVGCQLVRMTINNIKAAEAIKEIKKKGYKVTSGACKPSSNASSK